MPKHPAAGIVPPALALRREGTAAALSISVRMVDALTADGTLPHIRLGTRVVLYPVSSLERWLEAEAQRKAVRP